MKPYIEDFIREMKNRNYSANTIRLYSNNLKQFLDYSRENRFEPSRRIALFLEKRKNTPEQRRLAWSSIKLFYKLVLRKECPYKLDKVRGRKRLPDILSNNEIHCLLESIRNTTHRTMISMLYGSGLRVSEVCAIRIRDLDFSNQCLRVENSKGCKDRITLLSMKMQSPLKILIDGRKGEDFVFITQTGSAYSVRTVQKIFSDALARSGLQKSSTCHTLRHSFATHLVEQGVDIKTVKGLLGHKSIKTTMVYIKLSDPVSRKISSPL
ncbi:tyrosine-type recombinase/integrase [Spirochaeta isovalerica]